MLRILLVTTGAEGALTNSGGSHEMAICLSSFFSLPLCLFVADLHHLCVCLFSFFHYHCSILFLLLSSSFDMVVNCHGCRVTTYDKTKPICRNMVLKGLP